MPLFKLIPDFIKNYIHSLGWEEYTLIISGVVNIVLFYIVFYRHYRKTHPIAKLKIKRFKKDLPEFKVIVKNTGLLPVELNPPILKFKKRKQNRSFQVKSDISSFPVALFPKEEMEFIVDLARFYRADASLLSYKKIFMEIRNRKNKRLRRKYIKMK